MTLQLPPGEDCCVALGVDSGVNVVTGTGVGAISGVAVGQPSGIVGAGVGVGSLEPESGFRPCPSDRVSRSAAEEVTEPKTYGTPSEPLA